MKNENPDADALHWIPMAEIGECNRGQLSCPYNSVKSCYGCEKFAPLQDLSTHLTMLAKMRTVVKDVMRNISDEE